MSLSLCGCASLLNKVAEGAKDKLTDTLEEVAEGAQDAIDQAENGIEKLDDAIKEGVDALMTKMLHPIVKDESIYYSDENGTYYAIELASFEFDENDTKDYKALVDAVEAVQNRNNTSIKDSAKDMLEDAMDFAKSTTNDWGSYDSYFSDKYEISPKRSDSIVFSYVANYSTYYGGAHGGYNIIGYNFDSTTGEEIGSNVFFKDAKKAASLIYDALTTQYDKDDFSDVSTLESDVENLISEGKLNYVITYNGVKVIFNQYDIAPYASGNFEVVLYPEDNEGLFEEKYLTSPSSYISKIGMDTVSVDVNGDGKREDVTVDGNWNAEYYQYDSFGVKVGNDSLKSDSYAYSLTGYLVKNDDNYYVYVVASSDNDYVFMKMFDITGGKLSTIGDSEWGYNLCPSAVDYSWGEWNETPYVGWVKTACLVDPKQMILESHTDYLSTVSGYKLYHCDDNGLAVADDSYKDFKITGTHEFTALKKFRAVEVDESGKTLGAIDVPKGTKMTYYRTDSNGYGDVKTSDGKIVRIIKEESENFWFCIDGMDGNEVLDGVIFAG